MNRSFRLGCSSRLIPWREGSLPLHEPGRPNPVLFRVGPTVLKWKHAVMLPVSSRQVIADPPTDTFPISPTSAGECLLPTVTVP
ncbi:hypothetical protein OPV22_005812 [Ensete ventricosum]|uniref:Uncharacterized protein n=1 Tax=Ensete ventricosum TaxID=4639 RepID=A0AAV8Q3Y7_ENSVE|nr:hypothetical protein OPV22_005812 [Ensete ventricosum]